MGIFVEDSILDLCVIFMTFSIMCFASSEVTMTSPSKGSTQGGTALTIHGRFFDQTDLPVRVLVGGSFCFSFSFNFLLHCFIRSHPACALGICMESCLFTIVIIYLKLGILTKCLVMGVYSHSLPATLSHWNLDSKCLIREHPGCHLSIPHYS